MKTLVIAEKPSVARDIALYPGNIRLFSKKVGLCGGISPAGGSEPGSAGGFDGAWLSGGGNPVPGFAFAAVG